MPGSIVSVLTKRGHTVLGYGSLRVFRAVSELFNATGKAPTFRDVVEHSGMTLKAIHEAAKRLRKAGLLEQPQGRGAALVPVRLKWISPVPAPGRDLSSTNVEDGGSDA